MKKEFLSRPNTKEYDDGYDYIFGKKKKKLGVITVGKWEKQINPPVLEKDLKKGDWIGDNPYKSAK